MTRKDCIEKIMTVVLKKYEGREDIELIKEQYLRGFESFDNYELEKKYEQKYPGEFCKVHDNYRK